KYINLNVYYVRQTTKAYLLRLCLNGAEVWFPKSVCTGVKESKGIKQEVSISEFILRQKGYFEYDKELITEDEGVCIICGGKTTDPKYKYCKSCYKQQRGYDDYECLDCGRITKVKRGYNSKCGYCGSEKMEYVGEIKMNERMKGVEEGLYSIVGYEDRYCKKCRKKVKDCPVYDDGAVLCSECGSYITEQYKPRNFYMFCQKCGTENSISEDLWRPNLQCDVCGYNLGYEYYLKDDKSEGSDRIIIEGKKI
ncbi:MAG: hypothetical protein ACFFAO_06550, partial [Candidatus Hermodarchaeota archaeon]